MRLKKERIKFVLLYQLALYKISKYFIKTPGKLDPCQTFLAKRKHATWRNEKSGKSLLEASLARTHCGILIQPIILSLTSVFSFVR